MPGDRAGVIGDDGRRHFFWRQDHRLPLRTPAWRCLPGERPEV